MSPQQVKIMSYKTGKLANMRFYEDLPQAAILKAEIKWGPIRRTAAERIKGEGGKIPEHCHWDWAKKAPHLNLLAYRCMGISYKKQYQGLMMMNTVTQRSRLHPDIGKPMVYIDYLESAPWNNKDLVKDPLYGGIGLTLFEAAILYSVDEGYKGRIGLHSLPQAKSFYENKCEMTFIEKDPHAQNLPYYELSNEQALKFLARRN